MSSRNDATLCLEALSWAAAWPLRADRCLRASSASVGTLTGLTAPDARHLASHSASILSVFIASVRLGSFEVAATVQGQPAATRALASTKPVGPAS